MAMTTEAFPRSPGRGLGCGAWLAPRAPECGTRNRAGLGRSQPAGPQGFFTGALWWGHRYPRSSRAIADAGATMRKASSMISAISSQSTVASPDRSRNTPQPAREHPPRRRCRLEEPFGFSADQLLRRSGWCRAPQRHPVIVVVVVEVADRPLLPHEKQVAPWLSRSLTSGNARAIWRTRSRSLKLTPVSLAHHQRDAVGTGGCWPPSNAWELPIPRVRERRLVHERSTA